MRLVSLWMMVALTLLGSGLAVSVSCGAVLPSSTAASGTRTSPSSLPPVTSPSGHTVYTDFFDHYAITYPANWFIHPSSQSGGATSVSNSDILLWTPGRWKLDIISTPNPHGLTARQWADQQLSTNPGPSGCSATVITEIAVTVGGEPGLERHVSECRGTGIGIYVSHGARIFLMIATDQPEFHQILDSIVSSMVFTA